MKAAKITNIGKVEVVDVPIPDIGENDALIRLKASALCRSDLYLYHGKSPFGADTIGTSFTPGHEPCGVVEKIGSKVSCINPGDRVGLYMMVGCGKCQYCLQGDIMLCKSFGCIGYALDGAQADYIVLPAQNCLPLPEKMSFVTGALLTDVGGTLYTACKTTNASGATNIVIIGAGPMGCGGVFFAKGFGARVAIIDIDQKRLDFAKSIGADFTINPNNEDVYQRIDEITYGRGADITLECSGSQGGEDYALNLVRSLGKVAFIGENHSGTFDLSQQVIHKKLTVYGCWIFNKHNWQEITNFVMEKNIQIEKLATHKYSIEDADEAYRVFDSHIAQKVVFVWD